MKMKLTLLLVRTVTCLDAKEPMVLSLFAVLLSGFLLIQLSIVSEPWIAIPGLVLGCVGLCMFLMLGHFPTFASIYVAEEFQALLKTP
jgi:hypothetical protein